MPVFQPAFRTTLTALLALIVSSLLLAVTSQADTTGPCQPQMLPQN
jgi:hypothetical protein